MAFSAYLRAPFAKRGCLSFFSLSIKAITRLPERAGSPDNSLHFQILRWVSAHVLPRASPDYDRCLPQVSYWLIEVNAAGQATLEIGFTEQDTPVLTCADQSQLWSLDRF